MSFSRCKLYRELSHSSPQAQIGAWWSFQLVSKLGEHGRVEDTIEILFKIKFDYRPFFILSTSPRFLEPGESPP